jgi:hypothetical protein
LFEYGFQIPKVETDSLVLETIEVLTSNHLTFYCPICPGWDFIPLKKFSARPCRRLSATRRLLDRGELTRWEVSSRWFLGRSCL